MDGGYVASDGDAASGLDSQRTKLDTEANYNSGKKSLVASVFDDVKTDLFSFLNEYFMWFYPLKSPYTQRHSEEISALLDAYDVVVFTTVGCGYCLKAKNALAAQQLESPFSLAVLDVEGDPTRSSSSVAALKTALILKTAIFDLTFPQIVVKGTYIGGSDDLQ